MTNRNGSSRKGVLAAAALLWLGAACAGASANNNCDPHTIVANGRCFWEKDRACDAIGCLPPSECVVHEASPSTVECKKP